MLCRIGFFIRNGNLNGKTEKNIPHIIGFSQTAWDLISSIYKAEWNKLMVNCNNKTFRQCFSAQFIPKNVKKDTTKGNIFNKQNKTLTVSRIPFSILLRPSKKILEKSKFYKGKEKQDNKMKGQSYV